MKTRIIKKYLNNLTTEQKQGFTKMLKGKAKRYVVGLTNNENLDIKKISKQSRYYKKRLDNVTLGGRVANDGKHFIDVGTTTKSLKKAKEMQVVYKQQAIFDLVEFKEL